MMLPKEHTSCLNFSSVNKFSPSFLGSCLLKKGVECVRSQPLSEFWGLNRRDASIGGRCGGCGCNFFLGCLLCNGTLHLEKKEQTSVSSHDGHGELVISRKDSSDDLVDTFPLDSRASTHRSLLTLCGLSGCHDGNAASCRCSCYRKDHG